MMGSADPRRCHVNALPVSRHGSGYNPFPDLTWRSGRRARSCRPRIQMAALATVSVHAARPR
jgi:hypothetical protein